MDLSAFLFHSRSDRLRQAAAPAPCKEDRALKGHHTLLQKVFVTEREGKLRFWDTTRSHDIWL